MHIFKNFLKFSYGNFIGIFIGLLITVISTRIMSPSDFGIANIILISINILMMISMGGSDQSFIRFFHENETVDKVNTMKINLILSTVFTFVLVLILFFLNHFLDFFPNKKYVLFIIFIGTIIQIFYRMAITVIRMEGNGVVYSQAEIINKLFILMSILVFYFLSQENYLVLVFSTLAGLLGAALYSIKKSSIFWKDVFSNRSKEIFLKNKNISLKESYKYGIPLMITTTITVVFQATDRLILSFYVSSTDLGMYSAAMKLISLLMITQIIFSNYWVPLSYKKRNEGEEEELFKKIFEIMSLLMIILGFSVILTKDIIVNLLGEDYNKSAVLIPFLVFLPIFYTLSEITSVPINFMKKTSLHILISISTFLFNILFCIILVEKFGVIGASMSSALSYFLFYILRTYFGKRSIDYRFNYRNTVVPTILLICYAATNSFFNISFVNNLLFYLFSLIITLSFYKKITLNLLKIIFNYSRRLLNNDN